MDKYYYLYKYKDLVFNNEKTTSLSMIFNSGATFISIVAILGGNYDFGFFGLDLIEPSLVILQVESETVKEALWISCVVFWSAFNSVILILMYFVVLFWLPSMKSMALLPVSWYQMTRLFLVSLMVSLKVNCTFNDLKAFEDTNVESNINQTRLEW